MSHLILEDYTGLEPLPVREDGSKWRHALLQGSLLFLADTATELIAVALEEGYDQIPEGEKGDEDALLIRYQLATQYATAAQLEHVRKYVDVHGGFEGVEEDVINAAFTPRIDPIPLEGPTWNGPFPLVAIATNYAPFRPGVKIPKGDVVLVDPYTDTTLLESLSNVGVFQYRIHESASDDELVADLASSAH